MVRYPSFLFNATVSDLADRAGNSPSHFAKVSGPDYLIDTMLQLDEQPETMLLCVNDDITEGEEETSVIFKYWANDRWGTPAEWEVDQL